MISTLFLNSVDSWPISISSSALFSKAWEKRHHACNNSVLITSHNGWFREYDQLGLGEAVWVWQQTYSPLRILHYYVTTIRTVEVGNSFQKCTDQRLKVRTCLLGIICRSYMTVIKMGKNEWSKVEMSMKNQNICSRPCLAFNKLPTSWSRTFPAGADTVSRVYSGGDYQLIRNFKVIEMSLHTMNVKALTERDKTTARSKQDFTFALSTIGAPYQSHIAAERRHYGANVWKAARGSEMAIFQWRRRGASYGCSTQIVEDIGISWFSQAVDIVESKILHSGRVNSKRFCYWYSPFVTYVSMKAYKGEGKERKRPHVTTGLQSYQYQNRQHRQSSRRNNSALVRHFDGLHWMDDSAVCACQPWAGAFLLTESVLVVSCGTIFACWAGTYRNLWGHGDLK